MGIFSGGEKYSKEIIDEAIKTAKKADAPFELGPHDFSSRENFEIGLQEHDAFIADAKERVDKLFNAGRKEAVGTNEEYNKRVEKFMKEVEDFSSFAVNKLGMKRGQAREAFKEIVDSVLEDTINDVKFENTESVSPEELEYQERIKQPYNSKTFLKNHPEYL